MPTGTSSRPTPAGADPSAQAQDTEGIKALLALDVMDADAFAEGAALAAKADNAEAAALLADAEHKKRAAAPQKKRYDFDF